MTLPIAAIVWAIIQVTILCSITLAIAMLVRGRSPQWIASVLSGACIGCLVLAASVWMPSTHWTMFLTLRGQATVNFQLDSSLETTKPTFTANDFSMPTNEAVIEARQPIELPNSLSGVFVTLRRWASQQIQRVDQTVRTAEVANSKPTWIWNLSMWGGLFGFGCVLAVWLHGYCYMHWIVRRSQIIADGSLTELTRRLSREMGLRKIPMLRSSSSIPVGATVGFRRCIILLHPSWSDWNERELQAVLSHELAHVVRGDYLWVIVTAWLRVLFFFHPLVHLVVRRLRLEQELAADQLAAGRMDHAIAYGRALASLTLRCQQHPRGPSPMLAAEQICVTRRIEMLMQGSLKPRMTRSRWCGCLTLAAALVALPLSGLRGTPPESSKQTETDTNTVGKSERQQDEEKRLAAEKYKQLELKGTVIYRPGKIADARSKQSFLWSNAMMQAMFFGKELPKDSILRGECQVTSKWSDLQREHGQVMLGFNLKHGMNTEPGTLSQLFSNPVLGPARKVSEKEIDGHQAIGIGMEPNVATSWIIDDESGFVQGSEAEVQRHIDGHTDDIEAVPAIFEQDSSTSLMAFIWEDCATWKDRMIEHVQGSPDQEKVEIVYPLFDGLQRIGVFVRSDDDSAIFARLQFVDEASSEQAKQTLDGLIALGHAALQATDADELPDLRNLLSKISISLAGNEIRLAIGPDEAELLITAILNDGPETNASVAWSSVADAFKFENAPESNEKWLTSAGSSFAAPGFISQSIYGAPWRGQRIQLQAQFMAPKERQSTAGVVLWASDSKGKSLACRSNSIEGTGGLESAMKWQTFAELNADDESTWTTTTVEMDVPSDADVISLGLYAKAEDVRIRRVSIRNLGPSKEIGSEHSKPLFSHNLLLAPGQKILPEPTDLDFSSAKTSPQDINVAEANETKPVR